MKRRIPYAVANYEEIIRDRYYFVDKTRFIHALEQYKIPVFLRPRRFGKSLWCSILECYYDVNRKARFEELFGNTDIGRHPTPARNSHLVMRKQTTISTRSLPTTAGRMRSSGACATICASITTATVCCRTRQRRCTTLPSAIST